MAITIDHATQVISVDQADLTFVSGALYDFDTNDFRLQVGALLDDEAYIWMPEAFIHNTEITVAGTTFARSIQLINGYSITFEDVTMSVRYTGSNNDMFDVENSKLNPSGNVTIVSQNAAGLVNAGGDPAEVWAETPVAELAAIPGATPTHSDMLQLIYMWIVNEVTQDGSTTTLKDSGGTTVGSGTTSEAGGTVTKGKLS